MLVYQEGKTLARIGVMGEASAVQDAPILRKCLRDGRDGREQYLAALQVTHFLNTHLGPSGMQRLCFRHDMLLLSLVVPPDTVFGGRVLLQFALLSRKTTDKPWFCRVCAANEALICNIMHTCALVPQTKMCSQFLRCAIPTGLAYLRVVVSLLSLATLLVFGILSPSLCR